MTGFAEHRITRPGQLDGSAQYGIGPAVPAPTTDWNTGTMSGVQSGSDGGLSAIYSGTSQTKLFIPIRVDITNSVTLDSIQVGLNVCSDIGAGFYVALTYDGVTPSGVVRTGTTSAPATATTCTGGGSTLTPAINPTYDDWNNGAGFQGQIDINPNSPDTYTTAITACADVAGLGKRIRCTHDGSHNFGSAPGTNALLISGAVGNTTINGYQRIQVVDATHFDILGILSNGTQTGSAIGSAINQNFGILVWATSAAPQKLLIDYVSTNIYFDNRATAYYSGAADYCSKLKDLAGAYKCVVLDGGFGKLYAFWTEDTPAMPPYSSSPHNAGDSLTWGICITSLESM
jgi:hypothetical protein